MADLGPIGVGAPAPAFISRRVTGTVVDDASAPASRRIIGLAESTDYSDVPVVVGYTLSSPVTGAYILYCGVAPNNLSVIALDDEAGANYNHKILGRVTPI